MMVMVEPLLHVILYIIKELIIEYYYVYNIFTTNLKCQIIIAYGLITDITFSPTNNKLILIIYYENFVNVTLLIIIMIKT